MHGPRHDFASDAGIRTSSKWSVRNDVKMCRSTRCPRHVSFACSNHEKRSPKLDTTIVILDSSAVLGSIQRRINLEMIDIRPIPFLPQIYLQLPLPEQSSKQAKSLRAQRLLYFLTFAHVHRIHLILFGRSFRRARSPLLDSF